MPEIIFRFKPGGKTTVKVEGVAGEGCKALTQPFLDALAGQTVSDEPTDEMYETVKEKDKEKGLA